MTISARANGADPRIVRLSDGLYAQVVERQTPQTPAPRRLPQRLDALLDQLLITQQLAMPRLAGPRRSCTDAEHAYSPWLTGVRLGLELRLAVCVFCGVVEVRDVSLDLLPGVRAGRSKPRRRDDVLGWYSGRRPAGRQYL